jgi:hypothetical protein
MKAPQGNTVEERDYALRWQAGHQQLLEFFKDPQADGEKPLECIELISSDAFTEGRVDPEQDHCRVDGRKLSYGAGTDFIEKIDEAVKRMDVGGAVALTLSVTQGLPEEMCRSLSRKNNKIR